VNLSFAPNLSANSSIIEVSVLASPGGVTACRILITLPSAEVVVPSSSSCKEPANIISACRAVSFKKKSIQT